MTEEEGERWGLVPTHAYAVLDIRDYKVSLIGAARRPRTLKVHVSKRASFVAGDALPAAEEPLEPPAVEGPLL